MKTAKFVKGMHVYDAIFEPEETLTVTDIIDDRVYVVDKFNFEYRYNSQGFRLKEDLYGYWEVITNVPTLSTKPYTLEGFE